jgi:hypothetical protein
MPWHLQASSKQRMLKQLTRLDWWYRGGVMNTYFKSRNPVQITLRKVAISFVLGTSALISHAECSVRVGEYSGTVKAEWLTKTREMRLLEAFFFKGPDCKIWTVPKGAIVDGASIPQIFWSILGGPFEGRYRDASVVHDYYCKVRTESSELVHEMFYHAMLANGVDSNKAGAMFYAVSWFGPKWQLVPNLSKEKTATLNAPFGVVASTATPISRVNDRLSAKDKTAVAAAFGQPSPTLASFPAPSQFSNRKYGEFDPGTNWLLVGATNVNQPPHQGEETANRLYAKMAKVEILDVGDPKQEESIRVLTYAPPQALTQQDLDRIVQWVARDNPSLANMKATPPNLVPTQSSISK